MATATTLAEKINKNFLKCGICLEHFKNPRALPCLHAFCEECLERWAKAKKKGKTKEFACPNCMKLTRIPAEGIQGFPAHFLVNSLQETVNMEKTKEDYSTKLCSKCNKPDMKAVVYCRDCEHFLCKTCYESHSPWGAMKHHRVFSVEDLASGKVSLEAPKGENASCNEHEGEQNKFYCKTCGKPVCRDCIIMKQRCRDHDYVMLKEEALERSTQLTELLTKCTESTELCNEALAKVEQAKSELSESTAKVKSDLEKNERESIDKIKQAYAQQTQQVNQTYESNKDQLDKKVSNLTEKLQKLESTYEGGRHLVDTASHSAIISKYQSMHEMLQEACQDQGYEGVEELAVIPIPGTTRNVGQQWKKCREIKVTNSKYKSDGPVAIALTSDDKITIGYNNCITAFASSGSEDHCIDVVPCFGDDVAVDSKDRFVFVPHNSGSPDSIHVYDNKYELSQKCAIAAKTCGGKRYAAVTVDRNDSIVVGYWDEDSNSGNISSYNPDKQSHMSGFEVYSRPMSIAASAPGVITVVYEDNTLKTLDYSGKVICNFPKPPELTTWKPVCVCASKKHMYCYMCNSNRCEVFVLNQGDPKAIYRYTAGGEYIGCVTTEIEDVRGIAMSCDDQELYVTEYEDKLVKVFKRP